MENNSDISGYCYQDNQLNDSHTYLLPAIKDILKSLPLKSSQKKIFELGCGNGSVANVLHKQGFDVTGVDPSKNGIHQANKNFPHLKLSQGQVF